MSKTCQDYARNLKFSTYVHTHMQFQKIYLSENIPISTKALLIFLMSAFFCKSSISWQKEYLYSKQKYENCVRNFLVLFSDFVNVSFKDYACGIRLSDCSKLDINWKKDSDVTIFQHDAIVKFFNIILFLLSCLVTVSSFMSTSSLVLESW